MKNSTHGKMENDLWFPVRRGQLGFLTENGGWGAGGEAPKLYFGTFYCICSNLSKLLVALKDLNACVAGFSISVAIMVPYA